ncbi:MAG TPA: hypothetical protein VFV38_39885 [Ktedonobacteraceae bacterium]|nr:hypothetical protein [Ktedonobacteraceae bacterium]
MSDQKQAHFVTFASLCCYNEITSYLLTAMTLLARMNNHIGKEQMNDATSDDTTRATQARLLVSL